MNLKKNTLWAGGVLAVLTAVLAAYLAYQHQPPEIPSLPVVEVRRDNLILRGDVPKEFLDSALDLLTAADRSLRKEFPFLKPQKFEMEARFFAVQDEYQAFVSTIPRHLYDREACWVETTGSSDVKKFTVAVNFNGGAQRARQLLAHEYAHTLLNAGLPSPPLWLDEGLGLHAEACVTENGFVAGAVNEKARQTTQQFLRENSTLPLADLLALTHEDDNKLTSAPYYQCWSVFYFLRYKNENTEALQNFCRDYPKHYGEELYFFEQTFRTTAAELETRWREFAK